MKRTTQNKIWIVIAIILFWCVVAWLISRSYYRSQAEELIQQEIQLSQARSQDLVGSIRRNLSYVSGIPQFFSKAVRVTNGVSRFGASVTPSILPVDANQRNWMADPVLSELNQALASAKTNFKVDLIYVVNAAGDGIASSNWNTPGSVIGTNFSEREFFRANKGGRQGMQYAVGKTTQIAGLYFSSPVIMNGKFMGAVVAKVEVPNLTFLIKQTDALVVDKNGVIVLANDRAKEMHSLANAPVGKMSKIDKEALYRRSNIPELQITAWEDEAGSLQRIQGSAIPYVMVSKSIPEYGLTVYVEGALSRLLDLKRERTWFFLSLSILGSTLSLFVFSLMIHLRSINQVKEQLSESEERLALMLANLGEGVYVIDSNGICSYVNPAALSMLGFSKDELIGHNPHALFHHHEPDGTAYPCAECPVYITLRDGQPRQVEEWFWRKDGTGFSVSMTVNSFQQVNKQMGVVVVFQDITQRKIDEENLHLIASVFNNTQEAIIITDENNNILDINPAFTVITGYTRGEVLGKNPNLLNSGRQDKQFYDQMWQTLNENGTWRGEIWNKRKSGELYAELLSISLVHDENGKTQRHVAIFSDITRIKEHEAELSRVAHYDALTGVPNRVLLADRMKQAIAQTAREQNMMAICYLDLDGFKFINDTMGHEAGDQVLIEVSQRIAAATRGGDSVARLGGDEFVVLLLGAEKIEECMTTLERLLNAISLPITLGGKAVTVSASIGVTVYPLDDEDADTLLRHADQAMYLAKRGGKNCLHIYDPTLDKHARSQHDFMKSIRYALEENQFELYYQPKVNLKSELLVGAEALIRWRHPERGMLAPAEFLPTVENTDLDIAIGEWVTSTALAQMQQWLAAGLDIEVSINISAHHMESSGFVEKLRQTLARFPDIPEHKLQIEVLETVELGDIASVINIIESCRELGVGFALDDFGTGYSSLLYLSQLPVDTLKIDRTFVRDMLEDKGDMAIVQGILALARAFDRRTVAEGIETREHHLALLGMGCEFGQGYGIARPMPAGDLLNWSTKSRKG